MVGEDDEVDGAEIGFEGGFGGFSGAASVSGQSVGVSPVDDADDFNNGDFFLE